MNTTIFLMMDPSAQGGSSTSSIIFIVLMIAVFYFFMIRPQQKKMKEQTNFINDLKIGDRIVTTGGIHGKIVEVNDTTFVIQSVEAKIKIDKSAVSLDLSKAQAA